MSGVDFIVAIRNNEQAGNPANTPCQEFNQVKGCFVRPVNILKYHHHRHFGLGEFMYQGTENTGSVFFLLHEFTKISVDLFGNIKKGTQRSRREQRIASSPIDRSYTPPALNKLVEQRRLSNARLSQEEYRMAFPFFHLAETMFKFTQECVALE
jgi:hypothetical protein